MKIYHSISAFTLITESCEIKNFTDKLMRVYPIFVFAFRFEPCKTRSFAIPLELDSTAK